jgi:hypothetical protein
MSLLISQEGSVTLDKPRHSVCLEAAWEIEAIALMLPGAVEITDHVAYQSMLRVRCMAGRLRELASALMSGLDDEMVAVAGFDGISSKVLLCNEVAA